MTAHVLDISQVGVSRRLRGETPLDVNEVALIASYLDVPIGVLYGEPTGRVVTTSQLPAPSVAPVAGGAGHYPAGPLPPVAGRPGHPGGNS